MTDPDRYSNLLQEMKETVVRHAERATEIMEVLKKGANLPIVIADVLGQTSSPSLRWEWIADHFWANRYLEAIPRFDRIHQHAVENGFTEEEPFRHNDGENKLFYLDAPPPEKSYDLQRKVLVSTSQNFHFIVVWQPQNPELPDLCRVDFHLRRFWPMWTTVFKGKPDEYREEEAAKYQDKGIDYAIRKARWLCDNYSDAYEDNNYVERPSLEWHKNCGFKWQYDDSRDPGYIGSFDKIRTIDMGCRIDHAIHHHTPLDLVHSCYLPGWETEFEFPPGFEFEEEEGEEIDD